MLFLTDLTNIFDIKWDISGFDLFVYLI